jgi:hypothetical protein
MTMPVLMHMNEEPGYMILLTCLVFSHLYISYGLLISSPFFYSMNSPYAKQLLQIILLCFHVPESKTLELNPHLSDSEGRWSTLQD